MHPSQLSVSDFTYDLPDEKIARFPTGQRDQSKLLIYRQGKIEESRYSQLAGFLPDDSLLVFNNTRVIPARILFKKAAGGIIEIFLLSPVSDKPGLSDAMEMQGAAIWKCLIGGASKWKHGYTPVIEIIHENKSIILQAEIIQREPDSFVVRFTWSPAEMRFSEIVALTGLTPLPPYLKRMPDSGDPERYQTIFAESEGSVAAPTAGLHFTPAVFDSLKKKNIDSLFLTLHVGAGTFKPVKSQTMAGHIMHAEWIEIDLKHLIKLHHNQKPIFAVGTTSLRTLESIYWMGVKCIVNHEIDINGLEITQWQVYDELPENYSAQEAMNALILWMEKKHLSKLVVKTGIFIAPGYRSRMITGLITNFHQPQSTLLLLVAALTGDRWREIYNYALNHEFRFLSFGDGCLIYADE